MVTIFKRKAPAFTSAGAVLLTCCLGHFAVDGACVLSVLSLYRFSGMDWEKVYRLIILYNIIAFGLQPLFGWFSDAFDYRLGAAAGLAAAGAGCALMQVSPLAAVVVLAIGNSLFHTGAGAQVFSVSGGRAGASGIFIAPGAIGLLAGGILAKSTSFNPIYALPVLLVFAALFSFCPSTTASDVPMARAAQGREGWSFIAVMFLMIIVLSRSAVGYSMPAAWKGFRPLLFFAAAAFAGKSAGGALADRFGWRPVTAAMLLAAGGAAFFQQGSFAAACLAMLFIQATTGVTLAATQSLFPRRPAFAFGLPSVAILIGAYPFLLRDPRIMAPPWMAAALCLVAAFSMLGIKRVKGAGII